MRCKRISLGRLACGMAVGALTLAPMAAQADHHEGAGGGMQGGGMAMSAAPTQVSGTVLRYYVDRSGFVTAMDLQTGEGVRFVRFAPGMGQRLYTTYPVGQQASVWVVGNQASRWDVVGVGSTAPQGTMMHSSMVSDIDLLDAEPLIMIGQQMVTRTGRLKNIAVNRQGEVIGLMLDNGVLARVSREFRHHAPGHAGTERVTPLFRNSIVEVTGYPEAPRYGALSTFGERIVATALVVNARAVGAIGIPMMTREEQRTLGDRWGVDIGGTSMNADEMRASQMGYRVYSPGAPGAMGGNSSMSAPGGTSR